MTQREKTMKESAPGKNKKDGCDAVENGGERSVKRWCIVVFAAVAIGLCGCSNAAGSKDKAEVLRVANMEEYIDIGNWEEPVTLPDTTTIFSDKGMVERFEDWYSKKYGKKVRLEYSTVGSNEELYNLMSLGNSFDLVCVSEYMMMKLMDEGRLQPYSESFRDVRKKDNAYAKGLSPFIAERLRAMYVKKDRVDDFVAGYMWGTMGIVYNPNKVSRQDVKHWSLLCDPKYYKKVTMKDSIRDSSFVGLCIRNQEKYLAPEFLNDKDYYSKMTAFQNDTSPQTIKDLQDILTSMRMNAYSMETDSAKEDLVVERVLASMQWSGDGTYCIDCAEEEGVQLEFAVPEECTNLWFDGWVMMKEGIKDSPMKQNVAEAFVNYISRPKNVIRNMDYIGYTSVISGGKDRMIFDYISETYGCEEDEEEEVIAYDLGYFFGRKDAKILTPEEQRRRQLFARYPTKEVIDRATVMRFYDALAGKRMSEMWIDIRCFDPVSEWSFLRNLH